MPTKACSMAAIAAFLLFIKAGAAPAAESRPQPSDAAVPVPLPQYQSAFSGYRPPQADRKLDWKQVNDTVRDTGGHAGAMQNEMPAQHDHGQKEKAR